jgi:hypothetical protein
LTNAAVEQYTSCSSDPLPVLAVVVFVAVVVVFCVADLEEEEEGSAAEAPEDGFGPCAIGKAVNDSEGDKVRERVEGASKLAGNSGNLISLGEAWAHQQERKNRLGARCNSCLLMAHRIARRLTLCTHKQSLSPFPYRRDPPCPPKQATPLRPSPVRCSQSCAPPRRRVSLADDRAQTR